MLVRATLKMPFTGGLARDVAENTFWFNTDATTLTDAGNIIQPAIVSALNDHATGAPPLSKYLASYVSRTLSSIEFAEVTEATGVQVGDSQQFAPFAITGLPVSSTNLPAEVALCLSFGGTETGVPRASRLGRIYFGPLSGDAMGTGGGYARPDSAFRTALASGFSLAFGNDLAPGTDWVVYSRKLRTVTLVLGGWVDNEWDTQRRRGEEATNRINWGLGSVPA